MKNWFPSLVKNLEPTEEIVGMAVVLERKAVRQKRRMEMKDNMFKYADVVMFSEVVLGYD